MKTLFVYSSLTGNTKKVAETIYNEVPFEKDIYKSDEKFDYSRYDFIIVGYWVDRGICDNDAKRVLQNIHNKNIILFGTLGAKDVEGYYDKIKGITEGVIPEDNKILGHFLCQGKIRYELIARYETILKEKPDDTKIKEQIKLYKEASTHPDVKDLENAKMFIRKSIKLPPTLR